MEAWLFRSSAACLSTSQSSPHFPECACVYQLLSCNPLSGPLEDLLRSHAHVRRPSFNVVLSMAKLLSMHRPSGRHAASLADTATNATK